MPSKPVNLFVVLIGTNDLGAVACNHGSAQDLLDEARAAGSRYALLSVLLPLLMHVTAPLTCDAGTSPCEVVGSRAL